MTAVVAITDLTVALGSRRALDGITCTLEQTGLVGLIGPNGAGKSTLLRAVAGLLKPQRGHIAIDGADVSAMPPEARAKIIAYMPQDRTVHWPLPVRTIVALGRLPQQGARTTETGADLAAIDDAMTVMELQAFAARPVLELSGGERARVLMARALAQTPHILLADEPAAGLDPAHQIGLFEALAEQAKRGTRVIVALHDLVLAQRYCSDIVLLDSGRLVAHGPPADVMTAAQLAATYGMATEPVMMAGERVLLPTGRLQQP